MTSESMPGNRWPNLFLAGAAKAGTTSLHRYLNEHPDIAMSDKKETYFFSSTWDELKDDPEALSDAEQAYLENFTDADQEAYAGESTPGYLWHEQVPERIASRVDDPHIIISLRDPIERAHSDWAMARHRSGEDRTFHERIRFELDRGIEETQWGVINPGLYGTHVQRHLDVFGPDRVHVVLFEDLKTDPLSLLEGIAEFLAVDVAAMENVGYDTVHNPHGEPRNEVAAWLRGSSTMKTLARALLPERTRVWLGEHALVQKREKPPLEEEAARELSILYEPEIRQLEELLDQSLPELRKTWPDEVPQDSQEAQQ